MYLLLKRYYLQQLSRPGIVGLFVNPFYFARRGLLIAVRDFSHAIRGRVLDVGCGSRPYESLFGASKYVGLELDTPRIDWRTRPTFSTMARPSLSKRRHLIPLSAIKFSSTYSNQMHLCGKSLGC